MKLRLIDNWRDWWKLASMKLGILASLAISVVWASPEALIYTLNALPEDVREKLSPVVFMVSFGIIAGVRMLSATRASPPAHDDTDDAGA